MQSLTRPQFFDGQYIGADDLQAIVGYGKARLGEHLLAGHGWGIGAGLEIVELEGPGGQVEAWVQPGYCWDGYSRAMSIATPAPITSSLLRGKPAGAWYVWLSYRERGQEASRPGYGVCEGEEAYLRVAEDCELLVTGELRLDERQSGVMIGGTLRSDARLVRRVFNPTGPFLLDAAVPDQLPHPRPDRARWLIPLGLVAWDGAGALRRLSDEERRASRLMRRYVGSVAENLYAPDGLLRVRARLSRAPSQPDSFVETLESAAQPRPDDLVTQDSELTFKELLWVEGAMRVVGDARLFGGRLDFRLSDGTTPKGPFTIAREFVDANTAEQLTVAIGLPGPAFANDRMVVGPVRDPAAVPLSVQPVLTVRSDGQVGVGTDAPALTLDVRGDFGRDDAGASLHLHRSRIADVGDGKIVASAGQNVVVLGKENHRVGINSENPAPGAALEVRGGGIAINATPAVASLLGSEIRDNGDGVLRIRSGGATVAFDGGDRVGIGSANPPPGVGLEVRNGAVAISAAPAVATLLGSELRDDGDGVLRIRSGGSVVSFDGNDRIGIGTANPAAGVGLDVRTGTIAINTTPAMMTLLGSELRDNNDGILRIRSGGEIVAFDGNDRVGIRTASPDASAALDIVGNLRVSGSYLGPSDSRLKQGIEPITNALDQILRLRGVRFEFRETAGGQHPSGPRTGFLAEEVERVFPERVVVGQDGMKWLDMQGFEAILLEALREISGRIESLEQDNAELRRRLDALEKSNPSPRPHRRRKPRQGDAESA